MNRRIQPIAVVAALAGILLAGCSSEGDDARAPVRPVTPRTMDPADAPKAGGPTPRQDSGPEGDRPADVPEELRFSAPALGGGTLEGADFAGHDLVMWFWAPW